MSSYEETLMKEEIARQKAREEQRKQEELAKISPPEPEDKTLVSDQPKEPVTGPYEHYRVVYTTKKRYEPVEPRQQVKYETPPEKVYTPKEFPEMEPVTPIPKSEYLREEDPLKQLVKEPVKTETRPIERIVEERRTGLAREGTIGAKFQKTTSYLLAKQEALVERVTEPLREAKREVIETGGPLTAPIAFGLSFGAGFVEGLTAPLRPVAIARAVTLPIALVASEETRKGLVKAVTEDPLGFTGELAGGIVGGLTFGKIVGKIAGPTKKPVTTTKTIKSIRTARARMMEPTPTYSSRFPFKLSLYERLPTKYGKHIKPGRYEKLAVGTKIIALAKKKTTLPSGHTAWTASQIATGGWPKSGYLGLGKASGGTAVIQKVTPGVKTVERLVPIKGPIWGGRIRGYRFISEAIKTTKTIPTTQFIPITKVPVTPFTILGGLTGLRVPTETPIIETERQEQEELLKERYEDTLLKQRQEQITAQKQKILLRQRVKVTPIQEPIIKLISKVEPIAEQIQEQDPILLTAQGLQQIPYQKPVVKVKTILTPPYKPPVIPIVKVPPFKKPPKIPTPILITVPTVKPPRRLPKGLDVEKEKKKLIKKKGKIVGELRKYPIKKVEEMLK